MSCNVAIIGRPNVGKSTLFNRMAGKKLALVHDTPGVTRDWREAPCSHAGHNFIIVDTAGLEESFDESIESRMRKQTEEAVNRADVAVMVIDARTGITPMDRHFADWLRKRNLPTILLANKCEGSKADAGMYEAYELGLGEPLPISAEHGRGLGALYDALEPYLKAAAEREDEAAPDSLQSLEEEAEEEEKESWLEDMSEEEAALAAAQEDEEDAPAVEAWDDPSRPIKLAIVGRPNVGKSTLVNALLKEERVMTGPEPGVTRDAISVNWEYDGRQFRLVDTAGLRRKARVHESIERMAVGDTMRAIRLAHVVVLVLDANAVLDKQDLIIASHVIEEGRALIIAVNKWDAADDRKASLQRLEDRLQTSLPQARNIPTVTISALKGRNLPKLLNAVMQIYGTWNKRITTGRLNRWLEGMVSSHPPPLAQGRTNKVRYMTQIKSRPPTFAVWVSKPKDLPESYKRYLVNGLRETFDLAGTPIRINLRTSKNPYIGT